MGVICTTFFKEQLDTDVILVRNNYGVNCAITGQRNHDISSTEYIIHKSYIFVIEHVCSAVAQVYMLR